MTNLRKLNEKIRTELHLEAEEEFIPDDFEDEEMDDEPDITDNEPASGVILRINNDTKISANIKNLEFEIYYSDLAAVLTKDDRLNYTFTKEKAKNVLEIILEQIGFFEASSEKEE